MPLTKRLTLWLIIVFGVSVNCIAAEDTFVLPKLSPGVTYLHDIEIGQIDNVILKMDIAIPDMTSTLKPRAVVAFIHGGGWRSGNKNRFKNSIAGAAKRGYIGVSLMYRLSPEYQFPAQVEDVMAGIRYLKSHAKEYNLDPNKIIVRGGSAGGHLASMLGVASKSINFKTYNIWPEVDSSVLGVINYSGSTSRFLTERSGKYKSLTQFLGASSTSIPKIAEAAMPITYVDKNSANFFIVHGDRDSSVPVEMSRDFVKALAKENISYEYHEIKDGTHKLSKSSPKEFQRLKQESYHFIEKLVGD